MPKSKVWNFFTLVTLTKGGKKARCNLCQTSIKYCGNTTNLKNHLIGKHSDSTVTPAIDHKDEDEPQVIDKEDEETDNPLEEASSSASRKRKQATILEHFTVPKKTKKEDEADEHSSKDEPQPTVKEMFNDIKSHSEGKPAWTRITNGILYMIATDTLPFNFVEGAGFKKFMSILTKGKYKVPSRKTVTKLLDQKYETLKEKVKLLLQNYNFFTLTSDIWTEIFNSKSYISLTAHYYDPTTYSIKSVTLGVTLLEERHTAVNISETIEKTLKDWSIPHSKIVGCVTDNANNISRAIKDTLGQRKQLACFAHTLNLIVKNSLDAMAFKVVIQKVKQIFTYFKQNVNASVSLRKLQSSKGIEERDVLKLKQDIETRWNSTYDMLVRFEVLSESVNSVLLQNIEGPELVSAFEFSLIQDMISLLQPFKQATVELCGETYATCSSIIPMVFCLRSALTELSASKPEGNESKLSLLDGLNLRFWNVETNRPLSLSTFLDPRYKKIHFQSPTAVATLINTVSEFLKKGKSVPATSSEPTPSQSSSKPDIWSRHSQLAQQVSSSPADVEIGGIPLELRQYIGENVLDRKTNPFEAWESTLKFKYPEIYKIALKFLPLAATPVASERLFSKAGNILTSKRSRLKSSRINSLIFLGSLDETFWNL